MSSLTIQELMQLIDTQITILLNILSLNNTLQMMQAANSLFSYNVEVYQYSELIGKLMKVFLNSVNSFVYSKNADSDNDLQIIKEQLQKAQRTMRGPHDQVASTLTRQATENREVLKNKLHIMAAVQPIILITSYAATFGEHTVALHNPLDEEEETVEEIVYEIVEETTTHETTVIIHPQQ